MPILANYKTEVLPGNDYFHGIIAVKSGLRNEINIRIPGKDILNYVVKPDGNSGTKIVFKPDAELIDNNIQLPDPTPSPIPPQPEPTPSLKPEPTPTPAAPASPNLPSLLQIQGFPIAAMLTGRAPYPLTAI